MSLLKTDSVSKQLISYYDNYIFNFESKVALLFIVVLQ